MGVGLRSHPTPRTPGFGETDLYMTLRGSPGQPKANKPRLCPGAVVPPDVALDTCLVCQKGEGASPPGRQLESGLAQRWAV